MRKKFASFLSHSLTSSRDSVMGGSDAGRAVKSRSHELGGCTRSRRSAKGCRGLQRHQQAIHVETVRTGRKDHYCWDDAVLGRSFRASKMTAVVGLPLERVQCGPVGDGGMGQDPDGADQLVPASRSMVVDVEMGQNESWRENCWESIAGKLRLG